MTRRTFFVDANIIVHHLLSDHPILSPQAKELFVQAQLGKMLLYFDEVMIAEVVWVLKSFYKLPKENIARRLVDIVSQSWVINPRKKLIITSLERFGTTNFSYADCWALAVSKHNKIKLETFDKDLQKQA